MTDSKVAMWRIVPIVYLIPQINNVVRPENREKPPGKSGMILTVLLLREKNSNWDSRIGIFKYVDFPKMLNMKSVRILFLDLPERI